MRRQLVRELRREIDAANGDEQSDPEFRQQGGLERSIGSVIGWLDEVSGPPGQAGVAVVRVHRTGKPAMVLFGAEHWDALSAVEGQLVEVSGELWRLPDGEVCEVKKVTGVEVIPTLWTSLGGD